jgi:P4 family phage/plasmid primase-like protien
VGWLCELRSGEIREAQSDDYVTMRTAVFPTNTPTPVTDALMLQLCCSNRDMVALLWRRYGVTVTGEIIRKAIILKGPGANGKSKLIEALCEPLGDYGGIADQEIISTAKLSHTTSIAVTEHWRMITIDEIDHTLILGAWFKRFTGNRKLTGRKLYKDQAQLINHGTPWLSVNSGVKFDATSKSLGDRMEVYPCDFWLEEEKQDQLLPEKLAAEMSGILWKGIRAAVQFYANEPLPECEAVAGMSRNFISDADPFKSFLDRYVRMTDAEVKAVAPGGLNFLKQLKPGANVPMSVLRRTPPLGLMLNDIYLAWLTYTRQMNVYPHPIEKLKGALVEAGYPWGRDRLNRSVILRIRRHTDDDGASEDKEAEKVLKNQKEL